MLQSSLLLRKPIFTIYISLSVSFNAIKTIWSTILSWHIIFSSTNAHTIQRCWQCGFMSLIKLICLFKFCVQLRYLSPTQSQSYLTAANNHIIWMSFVSFRIHTCLTIDYRTVSSSFNWFRVCYSFMCEIFLNLN